MKKFLLFISSLTFFLFFNSSVFAEEDVITSNVYRQSMYYRNNSNNAGADTNQTTGGNSIVVPGAGSYSANVPVFFIFGFNGYKFNDGESYQVKVNIPYVSSDKDYDYSWNYNSVCELEELGTNATMPVYCTIEDEGKTLVFSFKSIYQINDSSLWVFRYGDWTNDNDVIINNMSATTHSESVNPNYRLIYNEKIDLSILENQNQTIINQNNQTNENLENINDNITDESPPDTSGLGSSAGWLPAGPVDSLINLPLAFFNSISRDLGSNCKPVSLPLPYVNKNLTLPCMSSFYDGIKINSFMDWVGLITSGFILFSYLLKLYKWVDDTLTFRENNHLDNWGGV